MQSNSSIFFAVNLSERIQISCVFHLFRAEVGINLSRGEVFVTENLFKYANVNTAVLIHQGSGSMAQLMAGISLSAQPDFFKIFIDHSLNGFY